MVPFSVIKWAPFRLTNTDELGVDVAAGAKHVDEYMANKTADNMKKILTSIEDARWGKGRFAHRLVTHIRNKAQSLAEKDRPSIVPAYIREGIEYLIAKVQEGRVAL